MSIKFIFYSCVMTAGFGLCVGISCCNTDIKSRQE